MAAENVIREFALANDVKAVIRDATRHYFGGYYIVTLQVTADVPLSAAWFDTIPEYEDALGRLGRSARFVRVLEKMAVPLDEVETVRGDLLHAFEANLLAYLSRPDFPASFVRSEYKKAMKQTNLRGYGDQ
jgi:hypothetical protein